LRSLADVITHLGATGQLGLLNATEVRVRRPAAHTAGWTRFFSGKAGANTVKALVITDAEGRLLCCGQTRPGAIHDLAQVRQAGLVELLALTPGVTMLADAGFQGLSAQTAGAVITPRRARQKNQLPLPPAVAVAHVAERRAHLAQRIRVEHGIKHLKNLRALLVTWADGTISTRSCARSPDGSSARNEPHDPSSTTANRELSPPAPGDRTRPGQVNDRPPLTMHEVVIQRFPIF
jgi:hypothetical protein